MGRTGNKRPSEEVWEEVWDKIFPKFSVGDILVFDSTTDKWLIVSIGSRMIHLECIEGNLKGMSWDIFKKEDHPQTSKFYKVGHQDEKG